jgi:hypothetical protein
MRTLKILVVVMGVMIVAGIAVLVGTIAQRVGGGTQVASDATFSEPAGTRIAGTSLSGDRLALQLQGGGPDRVVIVDLRNGHVIGRAALAP